MFGYLRCLQAAKEKEMGVTSSVMRILRWYDYIEGKEEKRLPKTSCTCNHQDEEEEKEEEENKIVKEEEGRRRKKKEKRKK
jgi:hypothetical protein